MADIGTSVPLLRRTLHRFVRLHDIVFTPAVDSSKDLYSFLFNRPAGLGALAVVLLTAALPSHGAGVQICFFRYLTGVPCPGCGLTRSFSCILHGDFARGYEYHPFGYVLLPLFMLVALTLFLPANSRSRVGDFIRSRQSRLKLVYVTFIYGFIAFGAIRTALYAVQGLHAL